MRHAAIFIRGDRSGRWWVVLFTMGILLADGMAYARMLPADTMQRLPQPWPPDGWSETLDLPDRQQTQPHVSEPRMGDGYFGQTLYRHIAGSAVYWTASVMIQDRGSVGAAWRAVSTVSCKSRIYLGYRARECERGRRDFVIKNLHYEVDRFYVTIQVSGPGDSEYPQFHLGGVNRGGSVPLPQQLQPRDGSRAY